MISQVALPATHIISFKPVHLAAWQGVYKNVPEAEPARRFLEE